MADGRWLGIHIKCDGAINASTAIALAVEAEALGFSAVTLNEDVGYDVVGILGAAGVLTQSVALGSAIMNIHTRTALQMAMGMATVDDMTRGRAMLGVSVGHHPWTDEYHGVPIGPSLARLREYVEFIRHAWSGERFSFDGTYIKGIYAKLGFPPFRSDIPIYIGGDRPKILALSAEIADGSIMNVVPSRYVSEFAAEHFFSSARSAGRHVENLELTAIVTCCVNDDRDAALRDARKVFIERLRSNPKKIMALRPGTFQEELSAMSAMIVEGNVEQAIEEISEELVVDTIAAGGRDEVMKTIERFYGAGCTRVLVAIYPRTPASVLQAMRALAPGRP